MSNLSKFEHFYLQIKKNRWYWFFSIFCRIALAYAFFVAGIVKIVGERFASGLSDLHPMGAYLEALYQTGYYYTFIGIAQVIAAILILIPRTVALGALLYLPIIVNIWLLSYAVRFEGSIITSPLMVLANIYLLVWNYDKLRYVLPKKQFTNLELETKAEKYSNKFPFIFASFVAISIAFTVFFAKFGFDVMPRNSLSDCEKQFIGGSDEIIGFEFCSCIHNEGNSLNHCLGYFHEAKNK